MLELKLLKKGTGKFLKLAGKHLSFNPAWQLFATSIFHGKL